MSLESLTSNLAEMSITERRAPILESQVIQEIFMNDADIYSAELEVRHYILEVPNIYCGQYYDDEDFVYSKLQLSNTSNQNGINDVDLDYVTYMMEHNLIINYVELDINSNSVIAKVLYIQQYINSYYTSLRHLRPINRIEHMPSDLLNWISNITDTVRILLDRDLFNYTQNETIPLEMFQEMIYGLGLITCHIRLICNHYKARGLVFKDLEEKHLKKIMRLANNLCVIMIYFWKVF
jgi:hypothetical protein